MAAQGEFFAATISQCYLPNRMTFDLEGSIDEFEAENRPMPVQEAKIRWKKVNFAGHYVCCAAAQKIAQAAHSLSRLGELHVKAGYVSTILAG